MQQQLCQVGRFAGETPYARSQDIGTWLARLEQYLIDLMSTYDMNCRDKSIDHFAAHITPADAIATFNYDRLMEHALDKRGKRWHHGLHDTNPDDICILKLHGSIDWVVLERGTGSAGTCVELFTKPDLNAEQAESASTEPEAQWSLYRVKPNADLQTVIKNRRANSRTFGLAGLGSYKPLHKLPGSALAWAKLEGAMRVAPEIYIIGFSLSEFDGLAHLYFRTAITGRHHEGMFPPNVTIIDPHAVRLQHKFESVFGTLVRTIPVVMSEVDWDDLFTKDFVPDETSFIADGKYLQMIQRGGWEMVFRKNMSGIVGVLAITEADEIVLIEQYRRPVGGLVIELPAGLAGDMAGSEDESFEAAARRELLEETGYAAADLRPICAGLASPGMTDEFIHYYLATGLTRVSDAVGDGHENITVHVVPRKQLLSFLQRKQAEGTKIELKLFAPLVYLENEEV